MLSTARMQSYFAKLSTIFSARMAMVSTNTSTVSNPQPQSQSKAQAISAEEGGSDRFACEVVMGIYPALPMEERFAYYGIRLVGTIPDLLAKCVYEHDILEPLVYEDKRIASLNEGIWLIYIQGKLWWEHNINYEFGTDDGDWVFEPDEGYPMFIPLSVIKPEKPDDKAG